MHEENKGLPATECDGDNIVIWISRGSMQQRKHWRLTKPQELQLCGDTGSGVGTKSFYQVTPRYISTATAYTYQQPGGNVSPALPYVVMGLWRETIWSHPNSPTHYLWHLLSDMALNSKLRLRKQISLDAISQCVPKINQVLGPLEVNLRTYLPPG